MEYTIWIDAATKKTDLVELRIHVWCRELHVVQRNAHSSITNARHNPDHTIVRN